MKFLLPILLFTASILNAQNWVLTDSITIEFNGDVTDFDVDDFNNIYYIRNFSELNKIDFRTKKTKTFSNQTVLEDLNTQNILEITMKSSLFKLLILDNQLNPISDPVEFPLEADFSPTLMSVVDNNYLWGYDPVIQRLVLWDYRNHKTIRQSVILSEKAGDDFFSKLIYHRNKIYLAGNSKILQFDEYGAHEATLPSVQFDNIYLRNGAFYFSSKGHIFRMDTTDKEISEIIPKVIFDSFSINDRYLFGLKDKVVYLYEPQKKE